MSFFLYALYTAFPHPSNEGCLMYPSLILCLSFASTQPLFLLYAHIIVSPLLFPVRGVRGPSSKPLSTFFFSVCHFFCTRCTRPSPTLQIKAALFIHLWICLNPLLVANPYSNYKLISLNHISFFLYAAYAGLHLSLLLTFFLVYVILLYSLYSAFPHTLNEGCLIYPSPILWESLLVTNPYSNYTLMLILLYHIFFFLYAAYAGLHLSF